MENNNMLEKGPISEREAQLKELAARNFHSWNEALLSREPQKVAALYSSQASFLPTLNPEFKKGQQAAEGYFQHFLEKLPQGEVVTDDVAETSTDDGGNVTGFLHSGLYDFEVGEPDKRQKVEARFSFLWQKENGEWRIRHHHSSVKPQ